MANNEREVSIPYEAAECAIEISSSLLVNECR